MSLAELESRNAKWKIENKRRETATRLPRIKTRKKTVNSERLMKKNTRRLITFLSMRLSIV